MAKIVKYMRMMKRHILIFIFFILVSAQVFCQESWTGTGFALNNGYIITNHHVVDGANSIHIYGVRGDISKSYKYGY